jgi:pimeloyl-ACP methyl ester carboxylesterase
LSKNAKEIARVVWRKNSPAWNFTEADLDRTTNTYENPAYVDIVLHVYRNGLGYAAGDPAYASTQSKLLQTPVITIPAVTLDGLADGNFPASNGSSAAQFFTGPRVHHQVPNAGHNLPQENPKAFIDTVIEVSTLK